MSHLQRYGSQEFLGILTRMMESESSYFILLTTLQVGERILCRHPFNESKRAYVVPQRVEELLKCYWPGNCSGATSFACICVLFWFSISVKF